MTPRADRVAAPLIPLMAAVVLAAATSSTAVANARTVTFVDQ
jgi:hypothetical protein